MANEQETEFKGDATQLLKSFKQIQDAMSGMAKAGKQMNDAFKNQQDEATKKMKGFTELLKKIPGVSKIAEIGEQSEGMSKGFARAAMGVAVAAIAMKAYAMVVDRNIERVTVLNERIRQQQGLFDKTRDAQDKAGKAGLAQNTDEYRMATGAVGTGMEYYAQKLTKTGAISREQAVGVVGDVGGKMGDNTEGIQRVLDGVILGARVGLNPREVAKNLLDNDAGYGNADSVKWLVANQLQEKTKSYGDPVEALNRSLVNQTNDPYQKSAAGIAVQTAGISANERNSTINYGARAAGQDAAEAANPGITMMIETFRDNARVNAELLRLSQAQGPVFGFIAEIFKPGGSFEGMLQRRNVAWAPGQ